MFTRRQFCVLVSGAPLWFSNAGYSQLHENDERGKLPDLEAVFKAPPPSARPYVLWMWMGSNVSEAGITRDLEAMEDAGIGGATIYTLADTLTPWAGEIQKSPTPDIIAFTEPWWRMIRHACVEAKRLGLELLLHNCAGYESSGGTWITPELSMQELVWSEQKVTGGSPLTTVLKRPVVDPHPSNPYPKVYIPSRGEFGIPVVKAKETYFRDVAVLAVPAEGSVDARGVIDLSGKMKPDGEIGWEAPAGNWTIYRFGHTTTGAMIQPAQWAAMGLECDKMNAEAVRFHVEHVLDEMKKHLGELAGSPLTTLYFDSYEAGTPSWTANMKQEFQTRRGYDPTPWLLVLTGRTIGSDADSARFKADFTRTIHDLYRDCYWATPGPLAHKAGLKFVAEPYEGPWEISEVVKYLDIPTVEFWTTHNRYSPSDLDPVVKAAHAVDDRLIAAESFTSAPEYSRWQAHPAWLKPIGDAAFCAGVNRINVHNFVQQPWENQYQPGNAMGQWGIHLGRNQTWWKPGKAWLRYLWRCQTLLQRGEYVAPSAESAATFALDANDMALESIHRRDGDTDIYFVANVSWSGGIAHCSFPNEGKQPELWDPVTGTMRDLQEFEQAGRRTTLPMHFEKAQSYFFIFRKAAVGARTKQPNSLAFTSLVEIDGAWEVHFDPAWGGPAEVSFDGLEDWTARKEDGIRYYSGTALYRKEIYMPHVADGQRIALDLGLVKHIAEVTLNGRCLGVVWTAPWRVDITDAALTGKNMLEIAVSNVWANRLIGDEQQPADLVWEQGEPEMKGGSFLKEFPDWFLKNDKRPSTGRYTFTTWNYFTKDSPLEPSGLIGPVRLLSSW